MDDPLGLLTDRPPRAEKDEMEASREYWAGLTSLQAVIEHGKLFLGFIGLSVVLGVATATIHVPLTAIVVFAALYVITLVICLRA